jgi:hypothetical protein
MPFHTHRRREDRTAQLQRPRIRVFALRRSGARESILNGGFLNPIHHPRPHRG